ncbi:MAG TPA: heavy metal-associated domain-containing protein [Bacteroidia bacterium]|jgi:copper chaperone CopZ|nr:heavy metal-associated domain-containing protein [Bacteroidia bacterium]HRG51675.1 heavy metal-associated domain-containing protein [Bacteroidia bacterium]
MELRIKYILITMIICLVFHLPGKAQFQSAVIGVDGLTCSACSFSTQKSLLELKSVDSVYMQLEQNTATVYFKKGEKVNVKDLAKKVVDAGFSVRSISAIINMNELEITPDYCWNYENDAYRFIKVEAPKKITGQVQLTFIGEKFMPAKEFKKWKMYAKNACPSNVTPTPYSQQYYVTVQ